MDDLIKDFIAETREMLEALNGEIVAWEAAPADRARLDEIFRFVHTVKGNCGFFDLPRLRALSHAAEDVLADLRAGRRVADPALVSAVLAVVDRIGELVQALESGEALSSEDDEQLIAALAPGAPALEAHEPSLPIAETRRSTRSIRLSVELLDRMMNGVSDAVLARNELARRLRDTPADAAIQAAFEQVSACIGEIRDAATRTRMQRVDSLFAGLPRMVRDLSAELGKPVRLELDGGDVELDREMIEMIRDPLTHIVRNAIDHGLEKPAERKRLGKPEGGLLAATARQSGNQILIEIADDGRGIDGDALVRKALTAKLLTPDRADRLTDSQKIALIFEPGLSTASRVTAISGRGVGMDVVRANIERIGGLVEVDSRPGTGVTFTIRVPLTLTIIPALTITAAGQMFALPRAAIEEILRVGGDSVRLDAVGDSCIATIRQRRMPLVNLAALVGEGDARPGADARIVLLRPAGGQLYALAVDAVHDHEELVVKPAAPAVMAIGLYAGTTLANNGRPVLLLDPSGIARRSGLRLVSAERASELLQEPSAPAADAISEMTVLTFRTLGGLRRAIRLDMLERIEDVSTAAISRTGGKLRLAQEGRILPLVGCDEIPAGEKLRVLRLTDGCSEIAYGFAGVADLATIGSEVEAAASPGEVGGVVLIDGEQVELLDPYWLFAEHADRNRAAEPLVCAMPLDDPWMATMLRPLVESAGYRVVSIGTGDADVVVLGPQSDVAAEDAPLVRLRDRPERAGRRDDTIYRYDRTALLSALEERVKARGRG